MPWKEVSIMSQRLEFITMAVKPGINMSRLCRQYQISRTTGYKWLSRFRRKDLYGLQDRSRRPLFSPNKTLDEREQAILKIRHQHPCWGGRKIKARLLQQGCDSIPAASTITEILRRHGCLDKQETVKHTPYKRFEYDKPNQLWQMDFKGYFPMLKGHCHPLTILDDHSRFSVGLKACTNEKRTTVRDQLIHIFRAYGIPDRLLVDNGMPWGTRDRFQHTKLTAWWIHLGIDVIHSAPYHPQTLGKGERFHRTLKAEVLQNRVFNTVYDTQARFDEWRYIYNLHRPHEALGMDVPASRYKPSQRSFPETLPDIEYGPDDAVRKVQTKGEIYFKGEAFKVGKAFEKYPVAVRPTSKDGIFNVFFCQKKIRQIDLRNPWRSFSKTVHHVPERV